MKMNNSSRAGNGQENVIVCGAVIVTLCGDLSLTGNRLVFNQKTVFISVKAEIIPV